jgi:hypothetical protein
MNYDENGFLTGNAEGVVVAAKTCRFEDVFPKNHEGNDRFGSMMPDVVRKNFMEIQAQKKLAEAAALIMDTMNAMNAMQLTDDQQRCARIKERMLKRKLAKK